MRTRHIMMDDEAWEAQKLRMRENTAISLENNEYGYAARSKEKTLVVVPDANGCPAYCPECHGENMVLVQGEDDTDYFQPCSRYEARKQARHA